MRMLTILSLIGCLTILCCACAAASPPANQPINPGDRLGDFVFSTGDVSIAGLPHNYTCTESETTTDCKTTAGTQVNISPSFFDNTHSGKIDDLWSEISHEMLIDGRPINLQAFGYIDVPNPMVGSVRKWNVAMLTDKPGSIVVQHSGVFAGKPFQYTATWTFTAP